MKERKAPTLVAQIRGVCLSIAGWAGGLCVSLVKEGTWQAARYRVYAVQRKAPAGILQKGSNCGLDMRKA